ncbi:leucyl/phenylalanyl-tRNA--protein transferase [Parahaliea mediterranea]|uniref:leucyl/phenylalanyl-tRNA--protein transferase n=1 Tax=Parahaliea mediterranea TaxID=651086 RepID=UPI000E2F9A4D|nr:leucyl/phenylalanyl-tRNA--protein transferase [Parahaliea mediterranea]
MALLSVLAPGEDFPPSCEALDYPNGLLAAGGDLSPETLLAAYRRGIFPWYQHPDPVLWWTPDPRSVLYPDELHISRSLAKRLRRNTFTLATDTCFREVMLACAEPRPNQDGTWIGADMVAAYSELHRRGHAHSIEVYKGGELAGGLYGIAIGGAFFGESMFARASDASKTALVALAWLLRRAGGGLIDCQVESGHMNSLGARTISRLDFERELAHTVAVSPQSLNWRLPVSSGELL